MSRSFAITKRGKDYDVVILETEKIYSDKEVEKMMKTEKVIEGVKVEDIIAFGEVKKDEYYNVFNENTCTLYKDSWVVFDGNMKSFNMQKEPYTLTNADSAFKKTVQSMGNPKCIIMFKDYSHKYKYHFLGTNKTEIDG